MKNTTNELKAIIKNGDQEKLKEYLNENKSLDCVISCKDMHVNAFLNPLLFIMSYKKELLPTLLNGLKEEEKEDFLSHMPFWISYDVFLDQANQPYLKDIYKYISQDKKKEISNKLMEYSFQELEEKQLLPFMNKKDLLKKILKEDNEEKLKDFIESNPEFNYQEKNVSNNYLITCLQNNSVLCFDVITKHLIKMKKQITKKIGLHP